MSDIQELSNTTDILKTDYLKETEVLMNSEYFLLSIVNYSIGNYEGDKLRINTMVHRQGGVGSSTGAHPKFAGGKRTVNAEVTLKRVFANVKVDNLLLATAKTENGKGAFYSIADLLEEGCLDMFAWNKHRILWGDGTGKLGATTAANGVQGTFEGANATSFIITDASWKQANWEVNNLIAREGDSNLGTDQETQYQIVGIEPDLKKIWIDGHQTVALFNDKDIYLQMSYNNDPKGLKYIYDNTKAKAAMYGVPYSYKWALHIVDAEGSVFTPSLITKGFSKVASLLGSMKKMPSVWVAHYDQASIIEDYLADRLTTVQLKSSDSKFNASNQSIGFDVQRYIGPFGSVYLSYDYQCPRDQMWLLNPKYIKEISGGSNINTKYGRHHGQWDMYGTGSIFKPVAGYDYHTATFKQYYENYITPSFHVCIENLAVASV